MANALPVPEPFHRRGSSRLRLAAPANFTGYEGKQNVTLLDLSQTGAKLAFNEPPESPAGFISWMGFETFGEVVWREGLYAGFEFDETIPIEWLLQTRHRADHIGQEEYANTLKAAREWVGV